MKKYMPVALAVVAVLLLLAVLLPALLPALPEKEVSSGNGLFSWHADVLEGERRDELFRSMSELGLTELYQYITSRADENVVADFLETAKKHEISVWYLAGEPEWGLDPEGTEMCNELDRAAYLNSLVDEGTGFCGVLMDCEPYLTEEWEEDKAAVMSSWISSMEAARNAAAREGLIFTACIPYYIDSMGYEKELEILVNKCCDALSVMNYNKGDEAGQIVTELELVRDAGKKLTVIYELQAPGKYGLTESNTYYADGLSAIDSSWKEIKKSLGTESLSYALHEYNAVCEAIKKYA